MLQLGIASRLLLALQPEQSCRLRLWVWCKPAVTALSCRRIGDGAMG